jgi:hypothetical protein
LHDSDSDVQQKYIDEADAVRECLMGLTGRRNFLLEHSPPDETDFVKVQVSNARFASAYKSPILLQHFRFPQMHLDRSTLAHHHITQSYQISPWYRRPISPCERLSNPQVRVIVELWKRLQKLSMQI